MKAGKLRHTVTVERYVEGETIGQPIQLWELVGTFPASVEPINGREYFAADAAQSEVTTRIRMRYQAGILPSDRITHGSTLFDVLSVRLIPKCAIGNWC